MTNLPYRIKKMPVSNKEIIRRTLDNSVDIYDVTSTKVLDSFVEFQCTDCGKTMLFELDIILEMAGAAPYPEFDCLSCFPINQIHGTLIPYDVFNVIDNKALAYKKHFLS
ncbi:MAG: hypothetical protein FWE36_07955 [Erysipelotrichales bacterium]|nr:hypothetical protein [Erysipelotrichales bacterium]